MGVDVINDHHKVPARRVCWGFVGTLLGVVVVSLARPPSGWDARALPTKPADWEADENAERIERELVVVAGLSRTGTSSLQAALMALNLTVHHTSETIASHLDFWYYYLNGLVAEPDVAKVIQDVDAVSDCWFAHLAPEILQRYPNAKVILTLRDEEPWLRSYEDYVARSDLYHWSRQARRLVLSRASRALGLRLGIGRGGLDLEKLPLLMDVWRRIDAVIYGGGSNAPNPQWRKAYDRHNAYIRSLVPENQLLEFNLAQGHGWRELLAFLPQSVDRATEDRLIAQPFPRLNCVTSRSCFSHLSARATKTHERLTALLLFLLATTTFGLAWRRRRRRRRRR
ncbi:hypothetical protein CTAYLR_000083 [Chrysophaeum taylorii]|uniref:Sulfotransferase n=1 Tax=Chrysophaeum taylorii TaxID=2483200 RepID=A0AAD7UHD7_9STRA|nr:hypothetical protein CTAYLR_000083 [Chrysophaeum taylorii]